MVLPEQSYTLNMYEGKNSGISASSVKSNLGCSVKNDGKNSKSVSIGNKSKAITTCYGNTLLIWPLKFDKWVSYNRNHEKEEAHNPGTES